MNKLKAANLYQSELIPVSGKLVERYNQCLLKLGFEATKLKSFSIDGIGWSPEIAEEKKELHEEKKAPAHAAAPDGPSREGAPPLSLSLFFCFVVENAVVSLLPPVVIESSSRRPVCSHSFNAGRRGGRRVVILKPPMSFPPPLFSPNLITSRSRPAPSGSL